eukprot:m.157150 g.157150  ORF g.157150 m.157150 type:complete len:261 (-) comp11727_c0_seq4:3717-4499(-)
MLAELVERHCIDRAAAKALVLRVLFNGSYQRAYEDEAHRAHYDDPAEHAAAIAGAKAVYDTALNGLQRECNTLYSLLRNERPDLHAMCERKAGNVQGRFMAHVYFEDEARVLAVAESFFEARGFTVGALVFDGLMVERAEGRDAATLERALRECEGDIQHATDFEVRLVEKPLKPTEDDRARLEGAVDADAMQGTARLIHLLTIDARLKGLRRMNGHVLAPHPTVRGVVVMGEDARDYVNGVLRADDVYNSDLHACQQAC